MRTLAVVAAGGLAREVLAVPGLVALVDRVAVLDDDPRLWGGTLSGHPVLDGGLERVRDLDGCRVLVCAGAGNARHAIVRRLLALGVGPERHETVVHPSVGVPASCSVGGGSILLAQVTLTSDVHLGRHVVAMPGVTFTHDDVVEDYATLCAGVSLGGNVAVGAAAYLGMNSSVRERVTVGRGATLGMGAALVRDLPDHETWVGVPARPVAAPVPVTV
jgi:sugar O-acyltransferase (sialic acid O-acetyltransferase NeuD family)